VRLGLCPKPTTGEVGALPQAPPRKLFEKSFLGTFKNFEKVFL
jgi:hypothetical protein